MTRLVKSSRLGTLPYVRVISGGSRLAAPVVVAASALEVELPVLVGPLQAVVHLALLALEFPLLAHLPRAAVELAVEVPLLHRSFSAATVGSLTSVEIPRYGPVPRSRRKSNSRL
jgi:hypothetical protein